MALTSEQASPMPEAVQRVSAWPGRQARCLSR